jgi:1-acyl-sn-glycerol-3-phosphate acyltransferase
MRPFRPFPVKRGEPDRESIKRSVAYLNQGDLVGVFPEGELNRTGRLLPIKAGIALIIRMAKCPVICCGLRETNFLIPYGRRLIRPAFRKVTVEWGEVRRFEEHTSSDEVLAWVESELCQLSGLQPPEREHPGQTP